MARCIGLVVAEHAAAGVVEDGRLVGEIRRSTEEEQGLELLRSVPVEEMVQGLASEAALLAGGHPIEAVGLALPGIVRGGIIEDSPNLQQLKGYDMQAAMTEALARHGLAARVAVSNDADVVAAGIAATHGDMNRATGALPPLIRVWTLGAGVGFGHHPAADGIWEGGHTVVSLDPNENFCGCGGRGHLEGIMGHRAMRLRFLDREPEEVFAAAKTGEDPRCAEFAILWHRALAAATATSIHLEGPGKFYVTGMNARFVNVAFLNRCVQEMVKLSPLQNYVFEVVPRSDEIAVIGAVVNALRSGAPY
ncbi:MAG TPA: ROK family protein [Bryobacteraceae bacterium]|jgi:predicted NBD/HSP70 family sugar kinase